MIRKLSNYGTATIHEAMGQKGALPSSIKPLRQGMKISGPVFPVISPAGDNLMLHKAINNAPKGSVIVADVEFDRSYGPWGDLMTLSAKAAGIAGLVIAGCVRDSDEIQEYGFPVFCLGAAIRGTTKVADFPAPSKISLGGVPISFGDYIVCDADGCVVVAKAEINDVIGLCQAREDKEENIRNRISKGESLQKIMNLNI